MVGGGGRGGGGIGDVDGVLEHDVPQLKGPFQWPARRTPLCPFAQCVCVVLFAVIVVV